MNNIYIMSRPHDRIAAALAADRVCDTMTDLAAFRMSEIEFPEMLTQYAAAVNDYTADPANVAAHAAAVALLYHISVIAARSVLSKVIDPRRKDTTAARVANSGYNPALLDIRADLTADIAAVAMQMRGHLYAYETRYNSNGDIVRNVMDADNAAALDMSAALTMGDGMDMIHTAAAALIAETAASVDRCGRADLTTPYDMRRLKKQVIIKSADAPAAQWETVSIRPIQRVFVAVRRYIMETRAASTDPRNGYTYIADYMQDAVTNAADRVYYRCGKYADIGGQVGASYVGNMTAYRATYSMIERLNLTARQANVLDLRLAGHGYKSIAAYLNVTQRAAAKQCELIAKKAEKIGFTPANIVAHAADLADLYELDGLTAVAVDLDEKAARINSEYNADRVAADLATAAALAAADRIAAAVAAVPALDDSTARAAALASYDNAHAAADYAARVAETAANRYKYLLSVAAHADRVAADLATAAARDNAAAAHDNARAAFNDLDTARAVASNAAALAARVADTVNKQYRANTANAVAVEKRRAAYAAALAADPDNAAAAAKKYRAAYAADMPPAVKVDHAAYAAAVGRVSQMYADNAAAHAARVADMAEKTTDIDRAYAADIAAADMVYKNETDRIAAADMPPAAALAARIAAENVRAAAHAAAVEKYAPARAALDASAIAARIAAEKKRGKISAEKAARIIAAVEKYAPAHAVKGGKEYSAPTLFTMEKAEKAAKKAAAEKRRAAYAAAEKAAEKAAAEKTTDIDRAYAAETAANSEKFFLSLAVAENLKKAACMPSDRVAAALAALDDSTAAAVAAALDDMDGTADRAAYAAEKAARIIAAANAELKKANAAAAEKRRAAYAAAKK